jgi:hypothetical protein
MLVSPFMTYSTTTLHLGGRQIKRQRLGVIMDFTTEEGLQELHHVLHEESVVISAKRLQTHIYVRSARQMCNVFQDKYPETAELWRRNMFILPERCAVSHDGRY